MSFHNPIALISLISAAVIILMYLIKRKHKEVKVPSIMLWEKAYNISMAQRPWQKLRRSLLMTLQILLALVVAVALAEPFVRREILSAAADVVLVLDASIGMSAIDVKPNRFESAKELMYDVIDRSASGTRFAVVSAAKHANIETNFSADREHVKEVIKGIKLTNSALEPNAAINLVSALCGRANVNSAESQGFDIHSQQINPNGEISDTAEHSSAYIFSGTGFEISDPGISEQFFVVGTETDNTGIILFSHVTEPDRIVALVKLRNYGRSSYSGSVALYTDDKLYDVKDVVIEPGSDKDIFFTQIPRDSSRLIARLSEPDKAGMDYLPADDIAYDVVRDEVRQKCLLVTDGNIFLEKALSLMSGIDLYKYSMSGMTDIGEGEGYFLYIFDGVVPDVLPEGHILFINPPESNPFFETGGEIDIGNIYAEKSRFVNFLPDMEFAVSRAQKIAAPQWTEGILTADDTDLIFAGEHDGKKIAVIGFDLHNSDLPLRKEFPIFIYNLVEWLVPGDIITSLRLNSGDEVIFTPYPNAVELRVVSPDNNVSVVAPPFPAAGFSDTNDNGFYIVRQNTRDTTVFSTFAVNPDSVGIAPLIQAGSGDMDAVSAFVSGMLSLKGILIALGILLLLIEWRIYYLSL